MEVARILVGVPTKNRPKFVKEAVRSILNQTFRDLRVIVSDNQSDPRAVEEVRAFVAGLDGERVSYYLQPVDGEEYGQGRYLFGQCKEEYFAVLHDDDRMEPDLIATAIAVLDDDPRLAFFSNDQYLIDESGKRLDDETKWYRKFTGRDKQPEGKIHDLLRVVLDTGVLSISGAVFRSAAVRRCGLVDDDMEGLYPFEFNVFLRQGENGSLAHFSRRELVEYRWHQGQQRRYEGVWSWNELQSGRFIKLLERRRYSGFAERKRRQLIAYAFRNHGYIQFVAGRWREGYRCLAKALRLDPFGWQLWAYCGFAVCFPFLIRPIWARKVKLAPAYTNPR